MRGKREKKVTTDDIKNACDRFLKARGVDTESWRRRRKRDAERGKAQRQSGPRASKIDNLADEIEKNSQG